MKKVWIFLSIIYLFICLTSSIYGGENGKCTNSPVQRTIEGIKDFVGRLMCTDGTAKASCPLAQPGSYSLTPPRGEPNPDTMKNLARESCK